jgi:hypothetical protein
MIRLRVVWGLLVVIAIFSPTRALSSVDFPTFGRPMMPINPDLYNSLSPVILIFPEAKFLEMRFSAVSSAADYIGSLKAVKILNKSH